MILVYLLSVAGWVAVLTRGEGPWGLLTRLRVAWSGGPLGCPACTGTWVGVALVVLELVAERWPIAWPVLALLVGAGAGALVSELYARLHERLAEGTYHLHMRTEQIERMDRLRAELAELRGRIGPIDADAISAKLAEIEALRASER